MARQSNGATTSLGLDRKGDSGPLALFAIVSVLSVVGLMMVLSASSVDALRTSGGAWAVFFRQLLWVSLGTLVLAATSMIDYHAWRRLVRPLLVVSFGLLLIVLIPGVGIRVGGSTRWLGYGSWRIQPSELAKFALLVFAADLLARRSNKIDDFRASVRPVLIVTGMFAALVMIQPDMGTTLILVTIAIAVLFASGVPLGPMAYLGISTVLAGVIAAVGSEYRRARLTSFLDPFADAERAGYQVSQSIVALGSGHVTGVGLGASRAKWGFLPNAHTDFIFAIIGEELGLVGTLTVVALFLAFAVIGMRTALRAKDRFGALLAAGITAWVVGQALINMGAVIGLLPVTGIPLPFVSFGGSAMVVSMAAVGVLRSIGRTPQRRPTGLTVAPPRPERTSAPRTSPRKASAPRASAPRTSPPRTSPRTVR